MVSGHVTGTCLDLAEAHGPVIVEGPFATNADHLDILTALTRGGVETAQSATATSAGAVMLCLGRAARPSTTGVTPFEDHHQALAAYATRWAGLAEV